MRCWRSHESETRLALAVRGTNDGFWDWDLRTGQVYYSARWKEMLGFDEAEIGQGPEEWLGRLHSEDLPAVMANLENHRSGHTKQFDCEYRILNKQNAYRWMHSRGLAIYDEQGVAVRMSGSQTDITAGKVADPLTGSAESGPVHGPAGDGLPAARCAIPPICSRFCSSTSTGSRMSMTASVIRSVTSF